jgi:cyanate permease
MSYICGYAAHMWELFAQRSWIVAFLVYCQSLRPEARPFLSATVVAALVNLAGVPASILGNEIADRRGRSRVIRTIMLGSAIVACLVGFAAPLPYMAVAGICLIYGVLCFADSAALTVGAVTASDPRHRGATMAVHSCIGFTCSFLGPLVFGIVLDAIGNGTVAWGLAFASLGVAAATGALLVNPAGARTAPRGE